jgi:hypothetical protein
MRGILEIQAAQTLARGEALFHDMRCVCAHCGFVQCDFFLIPDRGLVESRVTAMC